MKKWMICLMFFASSLLAEMSEPYRSTEVLPFDGQGWFGNASQLDMFLNKEINTVIEIGSWLGASTRYIASSLNENAKVYAVDTWAGSAQEELHLKDPRLPFLYQQFLSNVIHANLTEKIIPIRMKSVDAAKVLDVKADIIYIDGAHDTLSVLEDISSWYPHLKKDGIMCGDDWLWDSVRVAVIQRAERLRKKVNHIDNFWWYE